MPAAVSRPITTVVAAAAEAGDAFDMTIGTDDTYTTAAIGESTPGVLPPCSGDRGTMGGVFDQLGGLPAAAARSASGLGVKRPDRALSTS